MTPPIHTITILENAVADPSRYTGTDWNNTPKYTCPRWTITLADFTPPPSLAGRLCYLELRSPAIDSLQETQLNLDRLTWVISTNLVSRNCYSSIGTTISTVSGATPSGKDFNTVIGLVNSAFAAGSNYPPILVQLPQGPQDLVISLQLISPGYSTNVYFTDYPPNVNITLSCQLTFEAVE